MKEEKLLVALERAAEKGARRALESVGLHDEDAGKDIRDLRDLLDGWRQVRTGSLQALGKAITVLILSALAFFAGRHISGL